MKKVLSLILVFYSINFYSQEENKEDSVEINFIRTTGFAGSAQAFKTFIDSTFVCKLNNNKYSIHLQHYTTYHHFLILSYFEYLCSTI